MANQYKPGNVPELSGDVTIWARQLTSQLRSELAVLSKVITGISTGAATVSATTPSSSGGSSISLVSVPHDILGTTHTDATTTAITRGDILRVASGPVWDVLNLGATGTFLKSDGSDPGWSALADSDIPNILTITKISNLTTDGFVKTSGGDGTLSIDTNTYLTTVTAHDVLSATHGDTLADTVVLGDIIHGNATPKWARLAGNITSTKKWLSQTGTGAVSAAPSWDTLADSDIPDILTITKASNLTSNGFVKTSGGDGTLSVDTSAYITGLTARKNSGADVGTRPRFNFIEGTNVTLTVADDAGDSEIDITIAASGGAAGIDFNNHFMLMGG